MEIEKIDDSITKVTFADNRVLTLIGTAHISKKSVEDVNNIIENNDIDHICVELDKGRFENIQKKEDWSKLNIRQVLKQHKGFLMIASIALGSYQKRLGQQTGVKPGEEIIGAANLAIEKNISYSFIDRDIQITLKRAWKKSSFWNKMKLLATLISTSFSKEEISEKDLVELKEKDTLESMLNEMASALPMIKKVLIDERDIYLAKKIYEIKDKKNIVAVVGAGHCPGILKTLEELEENKIDTNTLDLEYIPPKSKATKVIPYIIPLIILGIIGYGFYSHGWQESLTLFLYWCASNAFFTGIFAIISLAHPLNILVSMIASPFTSLNPTIGVGIVSGILESVLRKPRVKDMENISEDVSKFKLWYKNRILHTLLVFIATSIGSTIGTFVAFPILIKLIA